MRAAVLILGATSSIAGATAAAFAAKGHPLYLAARDVEELRRSASDLSIRYRVPVYTGFFDAEAFDKHASFYQKASDEAGGFEGILLAFGDLGDNSSAPVDFSEAEKVITRNYTGACSILIEAAKDFSKKKKGFIIGISSVAGDRGRQSNYTYGSAKGALALYLQGLRNRLYPLGVSVTTIKLGFVDTAMTFGMPGLFLVASPEAVGKKIAKLAKSGGVHYIPGFWRGIMALIKAVPERFFKRLKL